MRTIHSQCDRDRTKEITEDHVLKYKSRIHEVEKFFNLNIYYRIYRTIQYRDSTGYV